MIRYFILSPETYEAARAGLDGVLGYPCEHETAQGTVVRTGSCLMPAAKLLTAGDGRVLVALSATDLAGEAAQAALAEALNGGGVEEISAGDYLAAVPPLQLSH